MNHNLTLGSLFDGSGGFPLGGLISGITPVWLAISNRTRKSPPKKSTVPLLQSWPLTVRFAAATIMVLRSMMTGAFCLSNLLCSRL